MISIPEPVMAQDTKEDSKTLSLFTPKYNLFSLMDEWINIHALEVSDSTAYNYRKLINKLKKDTKNWTLKELTQDNIQSLFLSLNDRGLATNTLIGYSKVLHMSLSYAASKEYIKQSPYKDIIIPQKQARDITPFYDWEVEKLLQQDMKQWMRDAIEIAFRTGLRKGELFALQKDSIDFKGNFIMVKSTQTLNSSGNVVIGKPKTKASRRRVDCDSVVIEILQRRCNINKSSFVFSHETGEMIVPWNISNTIKIKCGKAGLIKHRFHDFRHPYVKSTTKKYEDFFQLLKAS